MTFATVQHYLTQHIKGVRLLLTLMYLAGIIGLQMPWCRPFFQILSPYNLWFSLLLLLGYHSDYNLRALFFFFLCFFTGLLVEILGVQTGLVFGDYQYGHTLGLKIAQVPWVIGANWLLLVYCSGIWLNQRLSVWKVASLLQSIVGAVGIGAMMTALDVLIEPVAIRLDFWTWQTPTIPMQNYLAWFVLASVLGFAFQGMIAKKENPIASLLLALQVFFFFVQNLLFMWH